MNEIIRGAIDGEILSKEESVRVFIAIHPLHQTRHELNVPTGLTVREIIEYAKKESGCPYPTDVFVAFGRYGTIPQDMWDRVRFRGGSLMLRPVPRDPISLILAGVSAALGSLGGLFSGFFGQILIGLIGIGLKFLMNMLFAPKPKKQETLESHTSYNIAGSRNELNQWGTIPVVLGRHRIVPFMIGQPYTENYGQDQYLRELFGLCYGPVTISDHKIGETLVAAFKGATVVARDGTSIDSSTALYPKEAFQDNFNIELLQPAGYFAKSTPDAINEIQLDFEWPQGMLYVDREGKYWQVTSKAQIEYRVKGTPGWTVLPIMVQGGKTQNVVRRTVKIPNLASNGYDVRVKKAIPELVESEGNAIFQDFRWTALRAFRNGEPIDPDEPLAVVGLRIKASDQLSGVIDTYNCVVQSRTTCWNGSAWVADQHSENPADMFRAVLQHAANPKPVATAKIDLVALQKWWAYCQNQGFRFSKVYNQEMSVKEALDEICAAGRATRIKKDGKFSVVYDEQALPISQMFTPRNSWDFQWEKQFVKQPDALRVRFTNAEKGWADDEAIVYADGKNRANADLHQVMSFTGVNYYVANWKHARFFLASMKLRPRTATFMANWEASILLRADRVNVAHDAILIGLGWARVKAVDIPSQTITFDEVIRLSSAYPTYGFAIRTKTNQHVVRSVAGVDGDFTQLVLLGAGTLPTEGDLIAYGPSGLQTKAFRVLGIEDQGDLTFKITVVDDAPEISLADTGTIPEFTGGITQPLDPFEQPPTNLALNDFVYTEGGIYFEAIMARWELPRTGKTREVQIQYHDDSDTVNQDDDETNDIWYTAGAVPPNTQDFTIRRLFPGLYRVRVRAIFEDGTFSKWLESAVYNAQAINIPPGDVTNFGISTLGPMSNFSWDPVLGVDLTYEIRYSPLLVGATWNASAPLIQGISGTSAQGQTLVGTFLIKALSPNGLWSVNATLVITNVLEFEQLNVVATLIEDPSYAGVHSQTTITDGYLRLSSKNVMANWATLSSVTSLLVGDGDIDSRGFYPDGIYYFANDLDLGDAFTCRLTWDVDVFGFSYSDVMSSWVTLASMGTMGSTDPADWSIQLQMRTSQAGLGGPWTDWQPFVMGDVTARAFQFRLMLFGKTITDPDTAVQWSTTTPSVGRLRVTVDMPDRIDRDNNISCPIGGMDVTYVTPFNDIPAVNVTPQNMATGDYFLITVPTDDKFHIQFFNASNVAIAGRTFDWMVKGYGRLHA